MEQGNRTIDRARLARFTWLSMLASGPLILAFLYFSGINQGIDHIPAEYEAWFLAAGIASAALSLPLLRRFREATAKRPAEPNDETYWQRVNAAMSIGNAVAEIPLFIGFAAYLAGGFLQTALVLLFLTLMLQSRYRPPVR